MRALALVVMLAQPELLDRTLALVGGQPITLSDARAALALGLIDAGGAPNPIADTTGRLIRRELILREVQRYAPAPPSESAVEARLADLRKRFPDQAAIDRVLDANGLTVTRLHTWVRDDVRIEAYLAQRFASATVPSDAELARAYTQMKPSFDRQGLAFEQATPRLREQLADLRRRELIDDWVTDLQRRTEVVILQ